MSLPASWLHTVMFLSKEPTYPGTHKHYLLVKMLLVCYHIHMKKSRTTFPLEDKDREAIVAIREYYGVQSDADAIRIALQELLRTIKNKEHGTRPLA